MNRVSIVNQMFQFVVRKGPQEGHVYPLNSDILTIGRDPMSDIVVGDPEVSRQHSRLTRSVSGGYELQDLGSTNGTFIDGNRLSGEKQGLTPGQVITVGSNVELIYQGVTEQLATVITSRDELDFLNDLSSAPAPEPEPMFMPEPEPEPMPEPEPEPVSMPMFDAPDPEPEMPVFQSAETEQLGDASDGLSTVADSSWDMPAFSAMEDDAPPTIVDSLPSFDAPPASDSSFPSFDAPASSSSDSFPSFDAPAGDSDGGFPMFDAGDSGADSTDGGFSAMPPAGDITGDKGGEENNNRRNIIIAVVAIAVLCCCCLLLAYFLGDPILTELNNL